MGRAKNPFEELMNQGSGKKSSHLDLTKILKDTYSNDLECWTILVIAQWLARGLATGSWVQIPARESLFPDEFEYRSHIC